MSFHDDLDFANDAAFEPLLDRIYREYFPDLMHHKAVPKDGPAQRRGVDRIIYLASDKLIRIDEKLDRYTTNNFFLEFCSVDKSGAPGWAEKELSCDFLCYLFVNKQPPVPFIIPIPCLQYAWRKYGSKWKETYGVKRVINDGYTTLGVAVPIKEVRRTITEAMYLGEGYASLFGEIKEPSQSSYGRI